MHKFTFFRHLSNFPENLPNRTILLHQIMTELLFVVLALSDLSLLPESMKWLRLSSRWTTLCNPKSGELIYLPELHRNCLHVQLNYTFLKHSHQPSSLAARSLHYYMSLVYTFPQNCANMHNKSSSSFLCIFSENCEELPRWPLLSFFALFLEIM